MLENKPEKILITGCSGLLGATVLSESREKYDVFGLYLNHPIQKKNAQTIKLDITDKQALNELLKKIKPDLIYHTAAAISIDLCETDKVFAYKTNVTATETLAQYCAQNQTRFLFISTDAFFDGTKEYHSEEDEPAPMNYYAETKLLAEKIVRSTCENHLIIRTNIYGWSYQGKQSFSEWIFHSLKDKRKIPLVNDIYYTPLLTNTLVDCTLKLISSPDLTGTYHVASSKRLSKYEFGMKLCRIFGFDPAYIEESSVQCLKLKARRSHNMALDTAKFRKLFPGETLDVDADLTRLQSLL